MDFAATARHMTAASKLVEATTALTTAMKALAVPLERRTLLEYQQRCLATAACVDECLAAMETARG